jgi:DNA-binding transcriptional MerR regulator
MKDGGMIGEICGRAGCTPRTIRHYEAERILTPVATTPGGRKIYGEEAVSIIQSVQVLKRIGYSIREIRGILSLAKSENRKNKKLTRKLRKTLSSSLFQIQNEIGLLSVARGKTSDLIEKTKSCEGCGAQDCPPRKAERPAHDWVAFLK